MAELSTLSIIVLIVGVSVFLIILSVFLVWVFKYDRRQPKSSRPGQTAFQNQVLRPVPDQNQTIPNLQLADQRESAASGRSSGSGDYTRIGNFNIDIPEETGNDRSCPSGYPQQGETSTTNYSLGNKNISDAEPGLTTFVCAPIDGNTEHNIKKDKYTELGTSKEHTGAYSQATNLSANSGFTTNNDVGNSYVISTTVSDDSTKNMLPAYSLANETEVVDRKEDHVSPCAVFVGEFSDDGQDVSVTLDGGACNPDTAHCDAAATDQIIEPQHVDKTSPIAHVTALTHETNGCGQSDIYSFAKEEEPPLADVSKHAQLDLTENVEKVYLANNQTEGKNNDCKYGHDLSSPASPFSAFNSNGTNIAGKNAEAVDTDPASGLYFVLEETNEYDNRVKMEPPGIVKEDMDSNPGSGLYFVLEKTNAEEGVKD